MAESWARFEEEDLLPLSGLQHLVFCERQCALIHVEQTWQENELTASGRLLHERVDSGGGETRRDLRLVRGVRVRSLTLGLVGRVDAVELRRAEPGGVLGAAVRLPGLSGHWELVPVEYKRGGPKPDDCDRVQVCAQAMCLEEMTGARILQAQIYYARPRRRLDVALDNRLREETRRRAQRFHALVASGRTPAAVEEPKCRSCSLRERCLPPKGHRSVRAYLERESTRAP